MKVDVQSLSRQLLHFFLLRQSLNQTQSLQIPLAAVVCLFQGCPCLPSKAEVTDEPSHTTRHFYGFWRFLLLSFYMASTWPLRHFPNPRKSSQYFFFNQVKPSMVTHWIILNHWANGGDQLMVISFNAALCILSVSLSIQDNALLNLSLFCTTRFHSKSFFFQRLELLNSSEWCLLEELFLTWVMWILPLKGRTIS